MSHHIVDFHRALLVQVVSDANMFENIYKKSVAVVSFNVIFLGGSDP